MSVLPVHRDEEAPREWVALMSPAAELAKVIAHTDFVPKALRGNPAAIAAAILYGDEVGLGPMASLARIAVIDGKPTLAAEAQRALILAAGHDLWIEESTVSRVTIAGRRRDSDVTNRATWTMDDARRAGLAARPAWKAYPRQMLLARASAELARATFADAIGGLAATEEIDENVAVQEGAPTAPEAIEKPTRRRRRTTAASAVVSSAPIEEPERAQPPLPGELDPAAPTEEARRKMHALFGERGMPTREERLEFSTVVLGRTVETSADLSAEEVSTLIDELEKLPERPPPSPEGEST